MTTTTIPVGDRVLVEISPSKNITSGGIYIPDSSRDKPNQGTIRAIGEGCGFEHGIRIPFEPKVGDRILFSGYGVIEVTVETKPFVLVPAADILLILERASEAPQYVPEVDAAKL